MWNKPWGLRMGEDGKSCRAGYGVSILLFFWRSGEVTALVVFAVMNSEQFVLAALIGLAIRSLVATWGHSGYNSPPMHGDFEAHRHWMEVTTNLPLGEWYRNAPHNDLNYWGLDYPPLMAYFSWLCGKVAALATPELVALHTSRGLETVDVKLFMRLTVLSGDCLLLLPALSYVYSSFQIKKSSSNSGQIIMMLLCLLSPSLILIDHGHFQYNGMCIALAILAAALVNKGHDIWGSVSFCLSLNLKQMALYYAPVFFFVLLRKCSRQPTMRTKFVKLATIGATVILSFAVLWMPFCLLHGAEETCVSSLGHVLSRLFPFSRGIFEDKVANIWYALSVVFDYRQCVALPNMVYLSLGLTLTLLFPVCYMLFTRPMSLTHILVALINSSLAFFLASFQVHEKSLLLSIVPASLLMHEDARLCSWLQLLGAFTMYPLLKRDGLASPYYALCIMYYILYTEHDSSSAVASHGSGAAGYEKAGNVLLTYVRLLSYMGMIALNTAELFITPPARYPDLYPALFAIFGAANLCVVFISGLVWQHKISIALVEEERKGKSKDS